MRSGALPPALEERVGEDGASIPSDERIAALNFLRLRNRPTSELARVIQDHIVPRLLVAQATTSTLEDECVEAGSLPTPDEVQAFADLLVADDPYDVAAFVEVLARRGLGFRSLCFDLVVPAARLLGEEWLADRRSFTDVTIGLAALQRVVAALASDLPPVESERGLVVLSAGPGDQHTLAVNVLAELLRLSGWGVQIAPPASAESALIELVSSQPVVALGISSYHPDGLAHIATLVRDAKRASRNPQLVCLVGGSSSLAGAATIGAVYCESIPCAIDWLDVQFPPSPSGSASRLRRSKRA